jgi:hypothetical protein
VIDVVKAGFKKSAGLPFGREIRPRANYLPSFECFSESHQLPAQLLANGGPRPSYAFLEQLDCRFRANPRREAAPPVGCAAHRTVNVADLVTPAYLAMTFTTVRELTALVLTVALAAVATPETVTLAGTVAAAVLLLDSATTTPPAGAGPLSVTVAVELVPCVTLAGLTSIDTRAGGLTESVAVRVTPAYLA